MINKVRSHQVLSNYIVDACCENGICVTFDDGIDPSDYVIVKVDNYYNSLKIMKRPPSVDCLIIKKCIKSGHGLALVELKKIDSGSRFTIDNVVGKFETTLNDFIKIRFRNPLDQDYLDVKLYFVTKQEIYKRDLGLKMEVLQNKRIKFNNRRLMITPLMPTPTIKNCYR
jgi:hypothetical protein